MCAQPYIAILTGTSTRSGGYVPNSVTYYTDNWIQAMARANLDGYGEHVSYWIMPEGIRMMMHDSTVFDTKFNED